jgi:hypothetical protein
VEQDIALREIDLQIAVANLEHLSRLPEVDEQDLCRSLGPGLSYPRMRLRIQPKRNHDRYVKLRRAPQLTGGCAQLVLDCSARPRRFPQLSRHPSGTGVAIGTDNQTPLVMVVVECKRYLVSMLGVSAAWVRNVKAEGGKCGSASRTTRAGTP